MGSHLDQARGGGCDDPVTPLREWTEQPVTGNSMGMMPNEEGAHGCPASQQAGFMTTSERYRWTTRWGDATAHI